MTRIAIAALMVFAISSSSQAAWFLDFEWGLGQDGVQISSGIPGLNFTTTGDFDWLYADITTNNYNVTSDNGSTYGGEWFFMGGDVFAWLGPNANVGRIDFASADGSFFTTGYSSSSEFFVEAYDAFDNLIDATSGPTNWTNSGGTGLEYLTVSSGSNNIAYVLLHDTGNQWLVDNMRGDASDVEDPTIPEPATLFLLGAGLIGSGVIRRKFRK
jgi:hypothetical protein